LSDKFFDQRIHFSDKLSVKRYDILGNLRPAKARRLYDTLAQCRNTVNLDSRTMIRCHIDFITDEFEHINL
jgi:hypothetical protein